MQLFCLVYCFQQHPQLLILCPGGEPHPVAGKQESLGCFLNISFPARKLIEKHNSLCLYFCNDRVMRTERAKLRTFWMRSGAEMAPSTRSIRFFSSCMSACLWSCREERHKNNVTAFSRVTLADGGEMEDTDCNSTFSIVSSVELSPCFSTVKYT